LGDNGLRTRLLAIVIALVVLVVLGLGAPLAFVVATGIGQQLFVDRLTDTQRIASLAQHPLSVRDFSSLRTGLNRYYDVYRIKSAVLDANGGLIAGTLTPDELTRTPAIKQALNTALAARSPQSGPTLLPWYTDSLVVAEPVLVGGEVLGAAITVSDARHARDQVLGWWGILTAGGLAAIALAVLAALPVVRWILRPVRRLDEATANLGSAVIRGDSVEPVGATNGGPPELRRLSKSFDQMAVAVGDAVAAQRAFVADASHQLRNPMTALRLRLNNLAGQVAPEAVEHQTAAVAEADRLARILDELLGMARAESGAVEPIAVDVGQIVKTRLANWQSVAANRDVSLVLAGEPGGRAIALPRGLETILDALLDNALKFTGDGTLVIVEVRRTAERVSVSVRDHGPGLKPDELARATDRFWRSREHQNVPGTGLGLAIVRRIVERVGGAVAVELPDGGGLLVRFELPSAQESTVDS
jgi:signal transduction histidine kinase